MTEVYDLVVLGSGTAAQVASARMRAAGWTVAVVDHRPFDDERRRPDRDRR